jgi:hypothetical protein
MKQSGFHQACEAAFAECGGAAKGYIVEEEVLTVILLFAFTTCVEILIKTNFFPFFLFEFSYEISSNLLSPAGMKMR